MKEKTVHLFTIPIEWSRRKVDEFLNIMERALKKDSKGVVVRDDVKYTPLIIKEGDELKVIRKGDILEITN